MDLRVRLGRRWAPDPRDAGYPLRLLLPERPAPPLSRFYSSGRILDQGDTPRCVAYAWKQFLNSAPIKDRPDRDPQPADLYAQAQAVDEWAGTPHDGTSVRAGAKVLADAGRLGAYHWASNVEDIRTYMVTTSTVVIGSDWTEDMFDPSKEGFIKPTGSVAGGHAYLLVGYSQLRGAFRLDNSWGADWGQAGRAWITGEDLQQLLNRDGEACAGVELKAST